MALEMLCTQRERLSATRVPSIEVEAQHATFNLIETLFITHSDSKGDQAKRETAQGRTQDKQQNMQQLPMEMQKGKTKCKGKSQSTVVVQ